MRSSKLWAFVVHLILLFFIVSVPVSAIPPLTTVQDTLYKADGARFNGVAYIEWKSFQASDASAIASSSVLIPITDGALRVRLVPTSNASAGAHYFVRYHADGRVQFTETWNVPPSTTPLAVAAVRVAHGASTGGVITPPAGLTLGDIAGLNDELAARPVKGFTFTTNRVVMTGSTGALESVLGNLSDCIHVDGTTGPCGSGSGSSGSGPGFVDQEMPAGAANGSNTVFTLAQAPSPATSLELYRNGVLQRSGIDYTLSGLTISFGVQSTPQTGDLLTASYRLASEIAPLGALGGALTGSFPEPQIAEGVISNFNIASAAGIAESKLALNYATHSNANDPVAGEKAALSGTAGAPSASNKYVTDADARMTNSRTPVTHNLLSNEHGDTTAGNAQRGDLIVGMNQGVIKWSRLPLGPANRCLTSNGTDAIWNTCLFTGFHAGAIPFTDSHGSLAESPLHFSWDHSNRRLAVGSNWRPSTLTVYDSAPGASVTTLTVRGAQGQGNHPLQTWLDPAGAEKARVEANGAFVTPSIETVSTTARAAWREAGTAVDPSAKLDGDAWYNSAAKSHKTFEAGQTHTTPQVLCASGGGATESTSLVQLGSCTIPAGLLQPGDRLAVKTTWSHGGSNGDFHTRWRWGSGVAAAYNSSLSAPLAETDGTIALHTGGAVVSSSNAITGTVVSPKLEGLAILYSGGLTIGFEGNLLNAGDSLALLQFTVIRYPAQANP